MSEANKDRKAAPVENAEENAWTCPDPCAIPTPKRSAAEGRGRPDGALPYGMRTGELPVGKPRRPEADGPH